MALVNNCNNQATTAGLGDFSLSPVPPAGYLTALLAGAIPNCIYSCKAYSDDNSQWDFFLGRFLTQIAPAFKSVDSTFPGGFGGNSPETVRPPATFRNGDMLAGFVLVPVTPGQSPGALSITGGGGVWQISDPIGPLSIPGAFDAYLYVTMKVAASEPSTYQVAWANSNGFFFAWLISAWATGGSTPFLLTENGQALTSSNSIQAQDDLGGGVLVRLMFQFNFGGQVENTPESDDFTRITTYTGDQPAFGAKVLVNANSAPAIPNLAGPVAELSCAAVFGFTGTPDQLQRLETILSSNFNEPVNFSDPPKVLMADAAHEISSQPIEVVTTTSYVVGATDFDIVYDGDAPGVYTLLDPTQYVYRELMVRNLTSFVVQSATANVLPVDSETPTNVLLPGIPGSWARLKSNGTFWCIENTNIGTYGAPVAGGVFMWPDPLPFNDLSITNTPLFTTFHFPFTDTIDLGDLENQYVLILAPSCGSQDVVAIGSVVLPCVGSSTRGAAFGGFATGLSGSQALTITSPTLSQGMIGVFQSQFSLVVQATLGALRVNNADIAVAADSILLGVVDLFGPNGSTPPPSPIGFTGSTAGPTTRQDTTFDATGQGSLASQSDCAATWNIANAGIFNLVFSSTGANPWDFFLVNVTIAPPVPTFVPDVLNSVTAASRTVQKGEKSFLCDNAAGIVFKLPVNTGSGRELDFTNTAAGAVTSASSNVIPLGGGAAGTAILAASTGKWCVMKDDATSGKWVIVRAG